MKRTTEAVSNELSYVKKARHSHSEAGKAQLIICRVTALMVYEVRTGRNQEEFVRLMHTYYATVNNTKRYGEKYLDL